jgi:alpha-ribazole phosphatase
MLELILIRHGQTDCNRDGIYIGRTDVPLNKTGKESARRMGSILQKEAITAFYASDLQRCRQTAELLKLDKEIIYSEKLREIDFGLWEGLTYEDIVRLHPDTLDCWQKDLQQFQAPQGESFCAMQERVVSQIGHIREHHTGKVVVVTHGGCMRALMTHYLFHSSDDRWKIRFQNGAITRICFSEDVITLLSLNE